MPFAFPSHQGLVAPLWRRWPGIFDVPALCVGAAMPDVVDGIIGAFRGHLGQGLGHSLFGLVLFCIPGGILLWFVLHAVMKHSPVPKGNGFISRAWREGQNAFITSPGPSQFFHHWRMILWSTGFGAFSHLFFDLISHGGFPWLMPWFPKARIFPDWWYIEWTEVHIYGYHKPYSIGPHFSVWALLSILGIYLLFKPVLKRRKPDES